MIYMRNIAGILNKVGCQQSENKKRNYKFWTFKFIRLFNKGVWTQPSLECHCWTKWKEKSPANLYSHSNPLPTPAPPSPTPFRLPASPKLPNSPFQNVPKSVPAFCLVSETLTLPSPPHPQPPWIPPLPPAIMLPYWSAGKGSHMVQLACCRWPRSSDSSDFMQRMFHMVMKMSHQEVWPKWSW